MAIIKAANSDMVAAGPQVGCASRNGRLARYARRPLSDAEDGTARSRAELASGRSTVGRFRRTGRGQRYFLLSSSPHRSGTG